MFENYFACSRKPDIMADAAYVILGKDSGSYSGNFAVDEEVLVDVGVKDFDQYAHKPGAKLIPDFFLDSPEAEALVHKHGIHNSISLDVIVNWN